jgi:hypothetical protein
MFDSIYKSTFLLIPKSLLSKQRRDFKAPLFARREGLGVSQKKGIHNFILLATP